MIKKKKKDLGNRYTDHKDETYEGSVIHKYLDRGLEE